MSFSFCVYFTVQLESRIVETLMLEWFVNGKADSAWKEVVMV